MNEIPISKNDINFYGDTEKEKKANELIFDLTMEIDKLKNIISSIKEDYLNERAKNVKAIDYINSGKTFENKTQEKLINKLQNDLLNILIGDDKE